MKLLANILVGFVAIQHIGFLILEMFMWNKPLGLKIFKLEQTFANQSHSLAMNQGLYNGFLAAGLIWSLLVSNAYMSFQLKLFFLSCVLVAGVFGALTASKTILFIQAIPALITLVLTFIYLKEV